MTGRSAAAPLRTLLLLASFALTAYAGVRLVENSEVLGLVLWFAGAAVLHDLVLLPLYSGADVGLQRVLRRRGREAPARAVNFVRFPVLVSLVLLLTWYPLVLGGPEPYESYTTLDHGVFLERWLLLAAGLCVASALAFVASGLLGRGGRASTDATG
ncbi:hypothetical protein [Streptomyces sp. TR06-5]|uniref:hypothetical protein n=1 Tax=unclassified Streptomyces TaxID=2593676 RepID=UPI0039A3CCB1